MSASMTMSLCGMAQQASTLPSSRSMSISAKEDAAPTSTSPSSTWHLQVAQVPWPQANGSQTPWRSAAWRMVWPSSTSICSPVGSMVTW
ncbi:hypothetical protein D3C76_1003560 [compost metagenome]